jgi:hypothetical protein
MLAPIAKVETKPKLIENNLKMTNQEKMDLHDTKDISIKLL